MLRGALMVRDVYCLLEYSSSLIKNVLQGVVLAVWHDKPCHRARSCADGLSAFSHWSVTLIGFVLGFFLPVTVRLNNLFSGFKMCLYCTLCSSLRQRWFTGPGLQSLIPISKEISQEFICFLGTTVNKIFVFKIIDFLNLIFSGASQAKTRSDSVGKSLWWFYLIHL